MVGMSSSALGRTRPLILTLAVAACGAFTGFAHAAGHEASVPAWRERGWCSFDYSTNNPPPSRLNLPAWACVATFKKGIQRRYAPEIKRNPFFLTGDFDADGKTDIAIWVREIKSGKRGVAILLKGGKDVTMIGAGNNVADRGDDYSDVPVWTLLPRGEVLQSDFEGGKVTLRGDAIAFEVPESVAFALYWDGKGFAFYQLVD